jgi:hypothetical protein
MSAIGLWRVLDSADCLATGDFGQLPPGTGEFGASPCRCAGRIGSPRLLLSKDESFVPQCGQSAKPDRRLGCERNGRPTGRCRRRAPTVRTARGRSRRCWGDRATVLGEHRADRLDPQRSPSPTRCSALLEEPHENRCGRSSSAAKKTRGAAGDPALPEHHPDAAVRPRPAASSSSARAPSGRRSGSGSARPGWRFGAARRSNPRQHRQCRPATRRRCPA